MAKHHDLLNFTSKPSQHLLLESAKSVRSECAGGGLGQKWNPSRLSQLRRTLGFVSRNDDRAQILHGILPRGHNRLTSRKPGGDPRV